jgi:hypothetical protein
MSIEYKKFAVPSFISPVLYRSMIIVCRYITWSRQQLGYERSAHFASRLFNDAPRCRTAAWAACGSLPGWLGLSQSQCWLKHCHQQQSLRIGYYGLRMRTGLHYETQEIQNYFCIKMAIDEIKCNLPNFFSLTPPLPLGGHELWLHQKQPKQSCIKFHHRVSHRFQRIIPTV